jgi:pimeloyl-[acyl-carrier protein] methyl ester esterase
MSTIIFAHGWGFDDTVWEAVRARLSSQHRVASVDFGFFGAPHMPAITTDSTTGDTVIAVGHSLGACWWLAQSTLPWHRLLLVNGFPRFTTTTDYTPAVAVRVLARMATQFRRDPGAVLGEFRAACGAPAVLAGFDAAQLALGLDWLAQWDGRARLATRAADIHALAADNDPIVSAAMSEMALAGLPPGHLTRVAGDDHVLPLTAPDLCAALIERLAAT